MTPKFHRKKLGPRHNWRHDTFGNQNTRTSSVPWGAWIRHMSPFAVSIQSQPSPVNMTDGWTKHFVTHPEKKWNTIYQGISFFQRESLLDPSLSVGVSQW